MGLSLDIDFPLHCHRQRPPVRQIWYATDVLRGRAEGYEFEFDLLTS